MITPEISQSQRFLNTPETPADWLEKMLGIQCTRREFMVICGLLGVKVLLGNSPQEIQGETLEEKLARLRVGIFGGCHIAEEGDTLAKIFIQYYGRSIFDVWERDSLEGMRLARQVSEELSKLNLRIIKAEDRVLLPPFPPLRVKTINFQRPWVLSMKVVHLKCDKNTGKCPDDSLNGWTYNWTGGTIFIHGGNPPTREFLKLPLEESEGVIRNDKGEVVAKFKIVEIANRNFDDFCQKEMDGMACLRDLFQIVFCYTPPWDSPNSQNVRVLRARLFFPDEVFFKFDN